MAKFRIRLRDLAAIRVCYGYRRLHVLLRREGYVVNHKLVYRLYGEEQKASASSQWDDAPGERTPASRLNERWSIDFLPEQLFDGRRLRILTLVDNFSRESLAIQASRRFTGDHIAVVLENVVHDCGVPQTFQMDQSWETRQTDDHHFEQC